MLKGGVYYTWYRFSQASNYIHFEEWVSEYVDRLSDKEVEEFVARNKIGEVYVPKSAAPQVQPNGDIKIVILQRGWVMVGRFERSGSECKLHQASVNRNWGTTKGLGELAMNGPLTNTKLDKCGGVVEFDYLTVVAAIACEESRWVSAL